MKFTQQQAFERSYYIRGACEGRFTVSECADRLKVSSQRVKQLKRAYREKGASAFIHGNIGRTPPNKVPDEVKKRIIELKTSEQYRTTNFAHFRELLVEREGLNYGYTTIAEMLKKVGIRSPKKKDREN